MTLYFGSVEDIYDITNELIDKCGKLSEKIIEFEEDIQRVNESKKDNKLAAQNLYNRLEADDYIAKIKESLWNLQENVSDVSGLANDRPSLCEWEKSIALPLPYNLEEE